MSLLGIDIGTTGAKIILLEEDGSISANVTEEYETSTPGPLWSEQKPGDWWDACCAGVKGVLEASGKNNGDIKGVGVSGQMVGLVLLDHTIGACRVLLTPPADADLPRGAIGVRAAPKGVERARLQAAAEGDADAAKEEQRRAVW